jgi:hypothetical protein
MNLILLFLKAAVAAVILWAIVAFIFAATPGM